MLHFDRESTDPKAEINVGDSIEVRLPENPTTGYRWNVAPNYVGTIVLNLDTFQIQDQVSLGGGGTRIWQFTATKPGTIELKFVNKRSWENKHVDEFAVSVRVRA